LAEMGATGKHINHISQFRSRTARKLSTE